MTDAWQLASANLTSVPVLAFVLGIIAALIRSNLRLPDSVYRAISMVLLLAIGLKGGRALADTGLNVAVVPALCALGLGIVIPFLAFAGLRYATKLSGTDRGVIAAHYGSTSLVTFVAALAFLEGAGIVVDGYAATMLTIMEIPGIIVGLMLATRGASGSAGWSHGLREVLTSTSIMLLVGGLVIGAVTSAASFARVEPLFVDLFQGLLVLFLLHLGCVVGSRLSDVRRASGGVIGFALVFPIVAGGLGIAVGSLVGLSVGGTVILAVLCASASYIAAPAAVQLVLPSANPGLALTCALGITFPFNLAVGIPLAFAAARFVQ